MLVKNQAGSLAINERLLRGITGDASGNEYPVKEQNEFAEDQADVGYGVFLLVAMIERPTPGQ